MKWIDPKTLIITLIILVFAFFGGKWLSDHHYKIGHTIEWMTFLIGVPVTLYLAIWGIRYIKVERQYNLQKNAMEQVKKISEELDDLCKRKARGHRAIEHYWEKQAYPILEDYKKRGGFPNNKQYDMLVTSLKAKTTVYSVAKKYNLEIDDGYTDPLGMGAGVRYDCDDPRINEIQEDLRPLKEFQKELMEKHPDLDFTVSKKRPGVDDMIP